MLINIKRLAEQLSRTRVEDLGRGDIVYVYNPVSKSFFELEQIRQNADDTIRFHLTGREVWDVPEDCAFIPTLKIVPEISVDGSIKYHIEKRNVISYIFWNCKQFIERLISLDFIG
jgi:hypothetical protein